MIGQSDSTAHPTSTATTIPPDRGHDLTVFPTGLRVRVRRVTSGVRRQAVQKWFEVETREGRALTTWPTRKAAERHASGVPCVQRQFGGAWWLWRCERAEVFVSKEAAQSARRRKGVA